jgi:hypothetical protein
MRSHHYDVGIQHHWHELVDGRLVGDLAGLVAIAVWAFARWVSRPILFNWSGARSATELLRQRFARGEIGGETFERMRRQLEASRVAPRTPATIC